LAQASWLRLKSSRAGSMGARLCCQEDVLCSYGGKDCSTSLPIIMVHSVISSSHQTTVLAHAEEAATGPLVARSTEEPEEMGNVFDMEYFEDEPSPELSLPSLERPAARGPRRASTAHLEDLGRDTEVETFELHVRRDGRERLGLEVRHVGARLEVAAVVPGGAVARANAASVASGPTGNTLCRGDLIQQVNGVEGSTMDLAVECEAQLNLVFKVARPLGTPRWRPLVPPLKLPANPGSPYKSRPWQPGPARRGPRRGASAGFSPARRRRSRHEVREVVR